MPPVSPGSCQTEKAARNIGNELQRQQLQTTSVDYRQEAGLSSASPIAKDVLARAFPDVSKDRDTILVMLDRWTASGSWPTGSTVGERASDV